MAEWDNADTSRDNRCGNVSSSELYVKPESGFLGSNPGALTNFYADVN